MKLCGVGFCRFPQKQELRLALLRKASQNGQIGGSETQHFLYPRAPIAAPRTLYCPQTEERSASHPRINSRVSNRSPKWPKMDRIIAKMAKWTPTVGVVVELSISRTPGGGWEMKRKGPPRPQGKTGLANLRQFRPVFCPAPLV